MNRGRQRIRWEDEDKQSCGEFLVHWFNYLLKRAAQWEKNGEDLSQKPFFALISPYVCLPMHLFQVLETDFKIQLIKTDLIFF